MSSTPSPWAADTPTLLTKALRHVALARVTTAAGDTVDLDMVDGRVAFDETQSPRVQASLSCKVPADVATLGRIDARTMARLQLDAGYSRPDGTADVHALADLALRDRRVGRPGNTMAVTGSSDESLLIDAATCVSGTINDTTTLAAISTVIHQVLPAATVQSSLSSAGPAVNQSQVDTDRWDTVADLADRIGAQVFDDGLRVWHVNDVPGLSAIALTVSDGEGGTLVTSDAGLGRDDWANWVVLRYVWTDASNVRQRIIGSRRITSGPYVAGAGNIKFYTEDRETPTTQAQADAAAAALVARMVTRGRSLTISTPSAYWLRPGDTIRVQLPTGDPEVHLVARVEFDLRTGLMDITTRLPDNTGTIGA